MDQAKNVIAILLKHRFWVICGVVVVIAAGTWWMASSALLAQEAANRQKIKSAEESLNKLKEAGVKTVSRNKHPNQHTEKENEKLILQLKLDVSKSWSLQYEKQKHILVWPQQLSQHFLDAVIPLKRIEEVIPFVPTQNPPTPLDKEINIDFRDTYRNFIRGHVPSLADRIGAKWTIQNTNVRGGGDIAGFGDAAGVAVGDPVDDASDTKKEYIVEWVQGDQTRLLSRMSDFGGADNVPTTLQLLYAQEDLWIYTSLLDVIARTNGDISAAYMATIKRIDHILIGADVKGPVGQLGGGKGDAGGGADDGGAAGQAGAPQPANANAGDAAGQGGGPQNDGPVNFVDPAEGRYVDKNLQPLTAAALRSSYTSTNAQDAHLSVAKRMPVRIGLMMDQRKITDLLVECANSPLPVEVRQVRINRHKTKGDGGGGGRFGAMDGGGGGGGAAKAEENPYDIPVEIYGVIYLYNQPDDKKLKVEGEQVQAAGQPADASAPPAVDKANAVPAAGNGPAANNAPAEAPAK